MTVNRKKVETERWSIPDLVSRLPEELVESVEPQGDGSFAPSPVRIKQLALQKRREFLRENEEKPMRKATSRMILVAAAVCLMSLTAFAAFGGLDLIKGIFGESAESIQQEIVTPQASASAGEREMSLEALVTDGFVTNMVVSLTGDRPDEQNLFTVSADTGLRSNGWHVLEGFTTAKKTYYAVELVSERRFESAAVTLSLNEEVAPISLSVEIKNNLGNAVVRFPDGAVSDRTALRELQVSPMGFLLIGREDDAQRGLPATRIGLRFADGKTEVLEAEFDPSEETVSGGGGAILGGEGELPLVTVFHGTRNPDGELVITGKFSRVIPAREITAVVIEGIEYPVE